MNAVLKPDIENVRDRVSKKKWDLRVDLAAA